METAYVKRLAILGVMCKKTAALSLQINHRKYIEIEKPSRPILGAASFLENVSSQILNY